MDCPRPLCVMTNKNHSHSQSDSLGELTDQLLGCGAVLSQIVSHMVAWDASGRSAPDAAPIPEVARSLIRDVLAELTQRHTDEELKTAARIADEATTLIADNIFLASPDST